MTTRNDWPVVADDRPGGDRACFYCGQAVGAQHAAGCVKRSRTVVCSVTFTYVREVPEDWDAGLIDFAMNESSSCADNLLDEIAEFGERVGCLCGHTEGKYLREATEDDLTAFQQPSG